MSTGARRPAGTWASVRAVLFDLDDTLLDTHGGSAAAFSSTAAILVDRCPGLAGASLHDTYQAVIRETDRRMAAAELTFATVGELYLHRWTETLSRSGADAGLARELAEYYAEQRRANYRFYPEALEALEAVQQQWRVALVTNGPADLQWEKVRALALERRIPSITISGDLGIWKPDPGIFRHALSRIGCESGEAVMVGDSLYHDIGGAGRAGLRSVWINRRSQAPDPGVRPDATMTDLRPLPELLARWSAGE